ncbi:MAG TPA: PRC-barrel domain-containing protein [Ruminiclostridium sp.]
MLIKYSDVLGLPIISANDGIKIGTLKDVAFQRDNKGVIAFILEKGSRAVKGNVILLRDVRSIGNDALIIDNPNCLLEYKRFKKTCEMRENIQLRGFKIYTHSGEDIGIVQDIFFDYKTGKVEGVQVSDGLVQDILQGRNILPFFGKVEIGNDNILVENEAVEEMTSTGGGLISRLEN